MIFFETNRLIIKTLKVEDKPHFIELLTDVNVLKLIPQKPQTTEQINERFYPNLDIKFKDLYDKKCVGGIYLKDNETELIGLALFLFNQINENELGYRFREKYWGNGYGTEFIKGMLDFYFTKMKVSKVTADVNLANKGSVRILSKFMTPVKEFFNERDNCFDRTYEVFQEDWLK